MTESTQPQSDTLSYDDFVKMKLRVGRVTEAWDHPQADKLIVLRVDLGEEQRQICAGLRGYYTAEELVGKNLVIVANLAPRKMRGLESQGMLLAASSGDQSQVILVCPEKDIDPGSRVS